MEQPRIIAELQRQIDAGERQLAAANGYTSAPYREACAALARALEAARAELDRLEAEQIDRMMDVTRVACERRGDLSGEARVMRAFEV